MERPDWVGILEVLYHQSPPEWNSDEPDGHPFVERTNYRPEEVEQVLEELKTRGLIDWSYVTEADEEIDMDDEEYLSTSRDYELTKKGFDVAHDRELSKRQNTLNRSLVFFTFVLVIPEVLSLANLSDALGTFAATVLFAGMLYVIVQADLFAQT
ncbi:hypothetical protein [Halobacterium noricense]|uniref:hypothetical protein n=1 Tax=Halobacterium noricense TaxID=223182 RepID=UPI001E48AE07|nr:hypothetical protein [Halobacterium noricense]UHH26473.1 hypothetical protein LT974_05925 [Halobacterium noricense]